MSSHWNSRDGASSGEERPASGHVPLLEVRSVSKIYGRGVRSKGSVALEGVSLVVREDVPRIIGVAGASGSGKTTLGRLVLGFAAPTSGEVLYRGTNISRLSRGERRAFRREVQAVLQDPYEAYNPFYRVDHVFDVVMHTFHLSADEPGGNEHLVREALDFVGLDPAAVLGRFPHQLSGGQRQRLMLARSLMVRPRLLVADEPVSMVDASMRAAILAAMDKMKQEMNVSIIYITHDLATVYQVCDDIMVLFRGHVVESGDARRVIDAPQHPYTKLLVDCVPMPDPDVRWTSKLEVPADLSLLD